MMIFIRLDDIKEYSNVPLVCWLHIQTLGLDLAAKKGGIVDLVVLVDC